MYCTNCGRKLPEDGSPCVCRRQPAQPEQQTYTQPVQPQQNYGAPTQNFQMPPQYYAQPPVQYPVQRPITPVHGVLKSFFASPLFLITAILFSANLLFQIIASLFPQDPAYIVNQIYSNLPYEMQFIISPGDPVQCAFGCAERHHSRYGHRYAYHRRFNGCRVLDHVHICEKPECSRRQKRPASPS